MPSGPQGCDEMVFLRDIISLFSVSKLLEFLLSALMVWLFFQVAVLFSFNQKPPSFLLQIIKVVNNLIYCLSLVSLSPLSGNPMNLLFHFLDLCSMSLRFTFYIFAIFPLCFGRFTQFYLMGHTFILQLSSFYCETFYEFYL